MDEAIGGVAVLGGCHHHLELLKVDESVVVGVH